MKHLLNIILMCIICGTCTNNTQHYDSKNGHIVSLVNPNIVIIDSCEYGRGLAHKGDCKYCRKYFDSLIKLNKNFTISKILYIFVVLKNHYL